MFCVAGKVEIVSLFVYFASETDFTNDQAIVKLALLLQDFDQVLYLSIRGFCLEVD